MNFHEILGAVSKWLDKAGDAFQHWLIDADRSCICYPVLLGTYDGVYYDYRYIEEIFAPFGRIWKNYVMELVHVENDYVIYQFRVFEPVVHMSRYRLTILAEKASKLVLTSWMREHSYYFVVDSLVACHLEMEHLDVYMARTKNGEQIIGNIRKRTQQWKAQ